MNRDNRTRWASGWDVQSDVVELGFAWEAFVGETTIREANSNTWGNHLVAGLGSLTRSSAKALFVGTARAMVGVESSTLQPVLILSSRLDYDFKQAANKRPLHATTDELIKHRFRIKEMRRWPRNPIQHKVGKPQVQG